jgi:hypothetical protein
MSSCLHIILFSGSYRHELRGKSRIAAQPEVLDRFRDYVLQRRHLRKPKHFLCFGRIQKGECRDALREAWFSMREIRYAELCSRIHFFGASDQAPYVE